MTRDNADASPEENGQVTGEGGALAGDAAAAAEGEPAAAGKPARDSRPRAPGRGWRNARRVRRFVQVAALVFFVYLLFAALQRRAAFPFADLFFRFDPLSALATMVSARAWLGHLALALVTVGVTIALGRVFCGWICPLGTVLEYTRFRRARRRAQPLPPRLRSVKYGVLIVILAMAAFGSMTVMVADPLALLTRTMTTAFIPGFDFAFTNVELAMNHFGALQGTVNWLELHLRGPVLPVTQPVYAQSIAMAFLFFAVIALNMFGDRFWCRVLCPLGALLGLLAKVTVLRPVVSPACDSCNRCAHACRLDAIEVAGKGARDALPAASPTEDPPAAARPPSPVVISSECTMCLDCLVACGKKDGMSYGLSVTPGPWGAYDPGRRQFVTAAAGGVVAAALLGTGVWNRQQSPQLLRPPGADHEARFLSHCLRCTQCMKVCPTSGLQPALGEAGVGGLWTPVLKPRLGYCDYGCTACGHVCPSGAIPRLRLATKRQQVIGIASIDRNRCLPWSQDVPCAVCQEMCPVPDKAVKLTHGRMVTNQYGDQNWLTFPVVIAEHCIGCGICEYQCPVQGTAAIMVAHGNAVFGAPASSGGSTPSG